MGFYHCQITFQTSLIHLCGAEGFAWDWKLPKLNSPEHSGMSRHDFTANLRLNHFYCKILWNSDHFCGAQIHPQPQSPNRKPVLLLWFSLSKTIFLQVYRKLDICLTSGGRSRLNQNTNSSHKSQSRWRISPFLQSQRFMSYFLLVIFSSLPFIPTPRYSIGLQTYAISSCTKSSYCFLESDFNVL